MPQDRRMTSRRMSRIVSGCGMAAALSVVLMLTGGLIPVMTYISPLAAGVILLPVMMEYGRKYAWTCWLAAALIVLLLGVDREAAFFYLFFGYYPVLKWQIDKMKNRRIAMLVKIALFLVSAAVMYGLMSLVMGVQAVLGEFSEMGVGMTAVFAAVLVLCMVLYDRMLLPLALIYDRKIRPKLHLK